MVKLDPIPQMFLGNWPPNANESWKCIPWCLIVFMVGTMLKFRHWEFGVRKIGITGSGGNRGAFCIDPFFAGRYAVGSDSQKNKCTAKR